MASDHIGMGKWDEPRLTALPGAQPQPGWWEGRELRGASGLRLVHRNVALLRNRRHADCAADYETVVRWCRCPPSSATARPRRFRVSRPSCATARRRARRTIMLGAPKPAHKDMLGAPKALKSAPRKAPKAGPPTDSQPEEVTTPWHGGIVDYVRHLFLCLYYSCLDRAFLFLLPPFVSPSFLTPQTYQKPSTSVKSRRPHPSITHTTVPPVGIRSLVDDFSSQSEQPPLNRLGPTIAQWPAAEARLADCRRHLGATGQP